EGRAEAYVELVAGDMMDAVASSRLATFCDVFVDDGFFTADQARRILNRAKSAGLGGKIHADELADTGGAALAAEIGATSADHLLHASPAGIDTLARTSVVGVLLPATSLVSHLPFADGRRLIAAGVPVALGTDFNPNCWCESAQLTIALACHHNGLLPAQAVVAATINAAYAVGLASDVGSLEPGKLADLLVLGVPSYRHLGYRVGGNAVRVVIKRGAVQLCGPFRYGMPFVRRRRLLLPDSHSSMPESHDREDVARSDGDIEGRCVLPGAPGHRTQGVPRHARQPRRDCPPANGRGCDSFPPDHILGIVRCDPPLRRPESGAFRVLSGRQGVPPRVRADQIGRASCRERR